ncbi:MAG: bifunctional hydroxymethylpyrimidine kinase/phosphomethylpyrimidine kinase [Bradymonadia bacterium]
MSLIHLPFDFSTEPSREGPHRPRMLITIGDAEVSGLWGATLDARVFAAEGARCATIITGTALDAPDGPIAQTHLPASAINLHLGATLAGGPCDGVKLGRLSDEGAVKAVHEALGEQPPEPLVVAPALADRRGNALLSPMGVMALRRLVFPKASILVMDLTTAEQLTGRPTRTADEMRDACRRLFDEGCRNVLVTGGQLEGTPMDLFFDGSGFIDYGADRRSSKGLRGVGDVFTAQLLCRLSEGRPTPEAIDEARGATIQALDKALEGPPGLRLVDPMNPLYPKLGKHPDPVFDRPESP